ncbi:hypothetical protein [Streptomyces brasiliensis]|uniref:Uncharacterized protein n=1 Tax=Streptomyces brasiliensis TaxID=1954 RepID=A0A917KTD0_9ACTN|nr:hypothetical protein [Streptomyces brasiliensis]GGJ26889.1 hypothetical protein GCM10010121_042650 [Streptomyces brasiliensis]
MFQDSPIYDRLVAERGDIPAGVRREADRLHREVEMVMMPLRSLGRAPGAQLPPPVGPVAEWQRVPLPPGGGVF